MHKLFGSLYLIVAIATLSTVGVLFLAFSTDNHLEDLNYQGTFHLLDERIKQGESDTITLQQINELFAYEVSLKPLAEYDLPVEKAGKVANGESLVVDFDDAEFIYKNSKVRSGYVWMIQMDQMETDEDHDLVIGSARLIEEHLMAYEENQWPQKLAELNDKFGFPMELISLSEAEGRLLALNHQHLQQSRVVSDDDLYLGGIFYYRVLQSDWVVVGGPLPIGWFERVVSWTNNLLLTILLLFGLILAVAVLSWLWPLWRSLLSLNYAAEQFGGGNFDARAHVGLLSPIGLMSKSFNAMAARIQALISSHKELTNAVSHELRTPLARMQFALQELMEAENSKQKQHFYQEIVTDINELDALVNEMLVYASFERTRPDIEFSLVPLVPWVREQFERVEVVDPEHEYQLNFDAVTPNDDARFESRLLARALSNLLRNASRYADSTIQLTVTKDDSHYQFVVEDDGIGVPEKYRQVIFEPFQRVDTSRDRDTGGYGIGLAIVSQIADWHSGTCYVDESTLGGARFVLSLPRAC